MLNELLGRKKTIEAYVDSRSVCDVVSKKGMTVEKRLQTYIHGPKESYASGELSKIGWVRVNANPAYMMMKEEVRCV